MWKLTIVLFSLSTLSVFGAAQNTPWWELYGGYQFTHTTDISRLQDLADSVSIPSNLPRINVGRSLSMNGGNVSLQENAASWWGGIIDFSGSVVDKNVDLTQFLTAAGAIAPGTKFSIHFQPTFYTIAAGPQFTYRRMSRIQPFAHIMLGAAHSDLQPGSSAHAVLAAIDPTFATKDTGFALLGGGGIDYIFRYYAAFRLTGDYVRGYLFNDTQTNFRVSLGVDFRIGHK